jgi:hypothetical protein
MSMPFNGNLSSRKTEYHSFISDDLALEAIGMCSYTMSSMSGYLNPNNPDVVSYFDDKLNENKSALLAISEENLSEKYSIMRFDKDTKQYTFISGADIFKKSDGSEVESVNSIDKLLTRHNAIQLGAEATEDEKEIIKNIQISQSGCITFRPRLSILSCQRTPLVRLYIKNRTNNNTSRTLANNGPPLIAAVPTRETGPAYSYHDSANLPVGVYSNPQQGGVSNPANAIAAELKLTYNSALGKFESGTQQILARLLSDIDAAELTSIKDVISQIDTANPQQFIDKESNLYMGQFKTGIALPLTSENGNPYHFGPNMVGCAENNKKEKILVVNRSPRPFKAGDVVMCSQIGKEWIVQGFDTPSIQEPKNPGIKVGRWSFSKWIANSDYFFRDVKYRDNENFTLYSPNLYEDKFRYRYYLSLFPNLNEDSKGITLPQNINDNTGMRNIALMNMYSNINNTFDEISVPLALAIDAGSKDFENKYNFSFDGYNLETVFNQVTQEMGGTNDRVIFSRTNPYALNVGIEMFSMSQLAGFWGPIFPDGYNSQQCANFKNSHGEIITQAESKHAKANEKILFDTESNDSYLYHLPAEIATNGPFLSNKLTSPRETFTVFISGLKLDFKQSNLCESTQYYLSSGNMSRYEIKKDGQNKSIYALEPISTNKITFIPLSLEMMAYNYDPNLYRDPGTSVNQEYIDKYKYIRDNFLGSFINNDNIDIQLLEDVLDRKYKAIGVDTQKDGEGPVGGPDLLPDTESGNEKSNMVGIIGSKNTFSGNGSISFTTSQYFGLPPVLQSTLGQVGNVTILGGFITLGPGTGGKQYGYPRWGSSTDNYNSFGTTGLYVRIFEAWPDEQTIYDSRYFAVLHFNPGSLLEGVETKGIDSGISIENWVQENGVGVLNGLKYERSVDQIKYDVDFRVPTYGHPNDNSVDNQPIPLGSLIDRNGGPDGKRLRPQSEWRVNTIRRGQLLTRGGFRHHRNVIGLNDQFTVIDGGSKYEKDQEIVLTKEAKIKIISIVENGKIENISLISKGAGFMPSDFANKYDPNNTPTNNTDDVYGYIANVKANTGGTSAKIIFPKGVVYEKLYIDQGPLELTQNPVRLTLPSNRGADVSEGLLKTTVSLELSAKNKFDAFYFFQNDILHTISTNSLIPGLGAAGQYVTLEIGAG